MSWGLNRSVLKVFKGTTVSEGFNWSRSRCRCQGAVVVVVVTAVMRGMNWLLGWRVNRSLYNSELKRSIWKSFIGRNNGRNKLLVILGKNSEGAHQEKENCHSSHCSMQNVERDSK